MLDLPQQVMKFIVFLQNIKGGYSIAFFILLAYMIVIT